MLYIASDYAGYRLKQRLLHYLGKQRIQFVDLGVNSDRVRTDFTDVIPPLVQAVRRRPSNRGILICGTGYGMVIGANRFKRIRATLAHSPRQAAYARTHDNSNVLVLSAWQITAPQASRIVHRWLTAKFHALPRRVRRFKTIDRWPT